jgi:hypothetical protein
MELMVSVVLIVLIVLYMYGAVASNKLANERLTHHDAKEANRTQIFNILHDDLLQSISLQTEEGDKKNYTIVRMQTKNTFHEIAMPHVLYFVNPRTEQLIRLEATRSIELPIKYDDQYAIHADLLLNDVTDFNLYTSGISETNTTQEMNSTTSSSHKKLLLYLNTKNWTDPMLFEMGF